MQLYIQRKNLKIKISMNIWQEIIEFIDSHEEGSYKEINRLIKSVNQGEIQAVLVWDFNEIPLELRISLVEECSKRNVYIDGFLTSLEIKDNNQSNSKIKSYIKNNVKM